MAFSDDDYRRVFRRLRQQGELDVLLMMLREESTTCERELNVMLRTILVTDGKELAKMHALQGRLSAFAHLLTVYKTLGEDEVPKEAARLARDIRRQADASQP